MGITEGIKEILVVDDEPLIREIIIRKLSEFGYIATPVENAFEALNKMREKSYPLVLSDIMMPGMDGIELLKRLRSLYPDTAVVMITAVSNVNIAIEALREGAYDYLIKPFNFEEVVLSVKNAFEKRDLILENRLYQKHLEALVENQTSEIRQLLSKEQERSSELNKALEEIQITHDATIDALSAALDYRDNETEGHSQRVVRYSLEIGKVLGLERRNLEVLARGTLLHDIGKIGVPDSILWKPGKLTDEEWVEMRKHVEYGFKMLKSIHFLRDAALIVQHHHERYDGSGYPDRMSGDNIIIGARIFAIADTYDAMTTDRPYRKALTDRDAREEIKRCNGTQFDPKITEAFFQIPVEQWFNIKDDVDKQLRRYKERI
ncbi:MAG TPA: two-component system response regulator [Nitrospiraceae bacterium]|nr:two-component system response regulator [Nitrospiraceae bacterium]